LTDYRKYLSSWYLFKIFYLHLHFCDIYVLYFPYLAIWILMNMILCSHIIIVCVICIWSFHHDDDPVFHVLVFLMYWLQGYLILPFLLCTYVAFGCEIDHENMELLLSQLRSKEITELIVVGREKFSSVPCGGGSCSCNWGEEGSDDVRFLVCPCDSDLFCNISIPSQERSHATLLWNLQLSMLLCHFT
jgi:hypothetical protein